MPEDKYKRWFQDAQDKGVVEWESEEDNGATWALLAILAAVLLFCALVPN